MKSRISTWIVVLSLIGIANWNLREAASVTAAEAEKNDAPAREESPGEGEVAKSELEEPFGIFVDERLGDPTPEDRIRAALAQRVKFHLHEQTLDELIDHLKKMLNVNIEVDFAAFTEQRLNLSAAAFTLDASGITVRSGLNLLLQPFQMTWVVWDEVLLLTTRQAAASYRTARVYNVTELVTPDDPEKQTQEITLLIEAIQMSTGGLAEGGWDGEGGAGTIIPLRSGTINALIVRQTQAVHDEIESLLSDLGKIRQPEEGKGNRAPFRGKAISAPQQPPAGAVKEE